MIFRTPSSGKASCRMFRTGSANKRSLTSRLLLMVTSEREIGCSEEGYERTRISITSRHWVNNNRVKALIIGQTKLMKYLTRARAQ
uniref:Uncharacterized protein n=1 Tax=Anopheles minimus TaxID=112268 RepID=A0A182W2B7_9DIPT